MFSPNLEAVIENALAKARVCNHELMTVEVLLWALLDDQSIRKIVEPLGADVKRLKMRLLKFANQNMNGLSLAKDEEPRPTIGVQRILQGAILKANAAGYYQVDAENMLLAIFSENEADCQAIYFMALENLTQARVAEAVYGKQNKPHTFEAFSMFEQQAQNFEMNEQSMFMQQPGMEVDISADHADDTTASAGQLTSADRVLSKYAVNLNEK